MSSLYALSLLTTLSALKKMSRQISKANGTGAMTTTSSPFDAPRPQINGRRISLPPSQQIKAPSPLRIHVMTSQEVEYEDAEDEEDDEAHSKAMRLKRLKNMSLV
jgi:hypothetical protein